MTKKVRQYMDPKFMSVKEAAIQLVQIIENNPSKGRYHLPVITEHSEVSSLMTKLVGQTSH